MTELKEILERADRAAGQVPLPPDGMEQLERFGKRRRRRARVLASVTALVVAAGSIGALSVLRSLDRSSPPIRPNGHAEPSNRVPGHPPSGPIAQRVIGGEAAQRLGPFWFGIVDPSGCLRVQPLDSGPSWSFSDRSHDCVAALKGAVIRTGWATGTVHRDGEAQPATEFMALYGVVDARVALVEFRWQDGQASSVRPVKGRFLLVWSGSARPTEVTVRSQGGELLDAIPVQSP
jgi:hypothetical protein